MLNSQGSSGHTFPPTLNLEAGALESGLLGVSSAEYGLVELSLHYILLLLDGLHEPDINLHDSMYASECLAQVG